MSSLQALLVSTGAVTLAEIGDKTQLLALLLAARYRRPWPIAWGILVATLVNHALSAWLGAEIARWLSPALLRWLVIGSFLAVALWTLKPDALDEDRTALPARGAFIATTVAFFLAEIGDKTQVATVLMAARYEPLWQVIMRHHAGHADRQPAGGLAGPPLRRPAAAAAGAHAGGAGVPAAGAVGGLARRGLNARGRAGMAC